MKLLNLIFIYLMTIQMVFGQTLINTDAVQVGKKASTAAKSIKFKRSGGSTTDISVDDTTGKTTINSTRLGLGTGSNEFRVNGTDLEFTNDGSTYKKIGSGTGSGGDGGVNLLTNPGFEDGLTGFTNVGGTFTQQSYTTPEASNLKFARLVATTSGQYVETSLVAVPSTFGAGCMADFKYKTSTDSAFKISVFDSTSAELGTKTLSLYSGAGLIKSKVIAFPCPTSPGTVKFRLESLAAATIDFDDIYLGGNKLISNISQAKIAGESYFAGTASCNWARTSTTVGALTASATCPGPTIVDQSIGTWLTTDTDLPRQTINNMPPGRYEVEFLATVQNSATTRTAAALTDGTTTSEPIYITTSGSAVQAVVKNTFTYTTTGNRTFELLVGSESGTVNVNNQATAPRMSLTVKVKYWPLEDTAAISAESADFIIDANIGGANVNLGTTSVPTYTYTGSASNLDLVVNKGSVGIACEAPAASTVGGLTCDAVAANETFGITFNVPEAGDYKVCTTFAHSSTGGTVLENSFQLMETSSTSNTVLQEGKARSTNIGVSQGKPFTLCGYFTFQTSGQKTIRLMHEQLATGLTTNVILADRSASVGQRDTHWRVEKTTNNISRPVLTGDQVTSYAINTRHESCLIINNGVTATIDNTSGLCSTWISSVTRSGAGSVNGTFLGGTFSLPPVCMLTPQNPGANAVLTKFGTALTSTTFDTQTRTDTGVLGDSNFYITCQGRK